MLESKAKCEQDKHTGSANMSDLAPPSSSSHLSIGMGKTARRAYGFDEVALVPGAVTLDLELCDTSFQVGEHKFSMPIIASAMDSVIDAKMAITMGKLGGLAVLNLQGLQTRYQDTDDVYKQVTECDNE